MFRGLTLKLNSIKEIATINCPQELCFHISHDYDARSKWDSFIKETTVLEKDNSAPKRVWVKDTRGLEMIVDYTSYKPPKTAVMKMISGPFFFSNFGGAWVFRKMSDESTEAIFSYSFSLKKYLLPFFSSFIVKFILRREIAKRLNNFKLYCEETFASHSKT